MDNWWPFALFVLVELDNETIDNILKDAHGPYAKALWLATDKYEDAPKKQPNNKHSEGSTAPIPKDYTSPWIGARLENLVHWIKSKPEDTDLNAHHFAVLDKGARSDPPTIVICRTGGLELEGDKVYMMREDRVAAVEHLIGAPSSDWIEQTDDGEKNAEIDYDEDIT